MKILKGLVCSGAVLCLYTYGCGGTTSSSAGSGGTGGSPAGGVSGSVALGGSLAGGVGGLGDGGSRSQGELGDGGSTAGEGGLGGAVEGKAGASDAGAGGAAGEACNTKDNCAAKICSNGACVYGSSCRAILDAGGSIGSGTYWIQPGSGGPPFQAYCDMTSDGGGWTRVVGINATDHNHVTSDAVNPGGMTTADALGKFSDVVINALKSGGEPGLRLVCQNSTTAVTGYFSTTCQFSAAPAPGATSTCTAVSYTYKQPEVYGGQYTQACVVGVADGDHTTTERLIYGANADACNNSTTGCDTQYAHWSVNGSLWVR